MTVNLIVCGNGLAIARTSVSSALSGMNNYGADQVMQRTMVTFFGVKPETKDGKTAPKADGAGEGRLRKIVGKPFAKTPWDASRTTVHAFPACSVKGDWLTSRCAALFENIDKFLKKQSDAFSDSKKPRLFCNSDWLVETEELFDEDGNIITFTNSQGQQENGNLRTYPSSDVADEVTQDLLDNMQEKYKGSCNVPRINAKFYTC